MPHSSENRGFSYWQTQLQHSHTLRDLKAVGRKLASLKDQTDFLGTETKLSEAQLAGLRKLYSERVKKIEKETRIF